MKRVLWVLALAGVVSAQEDSRWERLTLKTRVVRSVVDQYPEHLQAERYRIECEEVLAALDYSGLERSSLAAIASAARERRLVVVGEVHRNSADQTEAVLRAVAPTRRARVFLHEFLHSEHAELIERFESWSLTEAEFAEALTKHQLARYPESNFIPVQLREQWIELARLCARATSLGYGLAPLGSAALADRAPSPLFARADRGYRTAQGARDRLFTERIRAALARKDRPLVVAVMGVSHVAGPGRLPGLKPLRVLCYSPLLEAQAESRLGGQVAAGQAVRLLARWFYLPTSFGLFPEYGSEELARMDQVAPRTLEAHIAQLKAQLAQRPDPEGEARLALMQALLKVVQRFAK